jgi:hypothetical protein
VGTQMFAYFKKEKTSSQEGCSFDQLNNPGECYFFKNKEKTLKS